MYRYIKNGANERWQLLFICCKQTTETANFRLFAANGKRKQKFVSFGRQMINGNRRLLFQQTCPSMMYMYITNTIILWVGR